MFTLQILDRGQTFLHSLGDGPVLLGSDPAADIVLREAGVLPQHARVERSADGVRLIALGPTRVNGEEVAAVDLALGDRIEIGCSVLVVGRSVLRAARADDVLDAGLPRARRAAAKPRRRWLVPAVIAVLALAGIGALAAGGGSTGVAAELAQVRRLRTDGRLDQARAAIARLQQQWARATDDRLARLVAEEEAIAAIDAAIERLTAAVLDPDDPRSYAEWSQALRALEHEGAPAERLAARAVRGNLRETIARRPPVTQAPPRLADASAPARDPEPVPTPPAAVPAGAPASAAASLPVEAPGDVAVADAGATVVPSVAIDLAEVERLAGQGLFAQAIALLQANLAAVGDEATLARLQARSAELHRAAHAAMTALLTEAEHDARDGDPRAAALSLHGVRHRFPPTIEFAALGDAIRRHEAAAAAPASRRPGGDLPAGPGDPVARAATLAVLRTHLDAVRSAEERCAFAEAADRLRAASELARERDPDFAARLAVRAEEMDLLAAWHDAVAAAAAAKPLTTTDARGRPFPVRSVRDGALVGGDGDEARLPWSEIPAAGLAAIVAQVQPSERAGLGAAVLLYRAGDRNGAEGLLARMLRAGTVEKDAVDRVISRGRGEPVDSRGYALGRDGFVAVRSVENDKLSKQLAARLDAALRSADPAPRAALWQEVLASGPEAVPVLVGALQRALRAQVARLGSSALDKQLARIAAQRAQLDEARAHAKELIFDERRYFYPYRPPAVSSDRYAEYQRVQAEVDRRVAALRAVWNDDRAKVRIPSSLRGDVDRVDWIAARLDELGELDHALLAQIEWARTLPPGDLVTVRNHCATAAERALRQEWQQIQAYNAAVARSLSSAQRELLAITNEYRLMFDHRPLAVVAVVCAAATGHAEEMSRLGYFAHTSPTPGRQTPYDRMKLAGYTFGVSENIALVDGASGAHAAWCRSSGHHRNLLSPDHREIGIGQNGRYWVQNFGSGMVHREDPAWSGDAPARR
jgi:uncharacterized protein YkwD